MRIAVFFDLPDGGARYALYKILEKLSKNTNIDIYTYIDSKSLAKFSNVSNKIFYFKLPKFNKLNNHLARIIQDIFTILIIPFREKEIANTINNREYDLMIVNHTRHFQAPYILRYLKGKVIFLCHEPTRAFFEHNLRPDKNLSTINFMYEKIVRFIKKHIEISNAQYAKIVLANSKFSQNQILKAYGVKSNILSMGVDTKEYFREKISKLNEVLVVGNDEPQKNLKLGIDTLAKLPKSNRPILHIVKPRIGELTKLTEYAAKKDVKIKISSQVNLITLRTIYNQAICTLAVARKEPFGLSVIESMACGTPVVAIREGGFLETVKHGVNGYLARRDATELAHFIKQVYKLDSLECRKYLKKYFDWDNAAKEILKYLD